MNFRQIIAAVLTTLSLATAAAVDVNKASQAELETVKGIGPGLSTKIMAARQKGNFKDWADLVDRVGGVGPGNAARFSQAGLTVAGTGYVAGPAAVNAPPKAARQTAVAEREGMAPAKKATPQ